MKTPYDDLRSFVPDVDEVQEMIQIEVYEKQD